MLSACWALLEPRGQRRPQPVVPVCGMEDAFGWTTLLAAVAWMDALLLGTPLAPWRANAWRAPLAAWERAAC